MKSIESVKETLYTVFDNYINGRLTDFKFVAQLERTCKGKGKQSYWWRFFPNDTQANDAASVNNSLQSKQNTVYLKECIEIALKERQMVIYYS